MREKNQERSRGNCWSFCTQLSATKRTPKGSGSSRTPPRGGLDKKIETNQPELRSPRGEGHSGGCRRSRSGKGLSSLTRWSLEGKGRGQLRFFLGLLAFLFFGAAVLNGIRKGRPKEAERDRYEKAVTSAPRRMAIEGRD